MNDKQPIGIWVTGKWGKPGWLEESTGIPTTFKSLVDAKDWIRVNAVHKEYYEPKILLKKFKEDIEWI